MDTKTRPIYILPIKDSFEIHTQIRKSDSNTTLKIVIKPQEKKGRKKGNKNKSKAVNKMAVRTYISIITLNVNGLNAPTKRHRLDEWIQKQDPYICCLPN